jgi:uncharacterized membrane protein
MRSKISVLLAFVLVFSVVSSAFASGSGDSTNISSEEGVKTGSEFESFEDIPPELLDPNYYSEDEIIHIPEEYLDPHHPGVLYTTYNPYGNSDGRSFHTAAIPAAIPAAAGVYFIPGIGQAAITVTGAIVIGGVTIAAGSLLYNQVAGYFAEKAYENAKKEGKKTSNHSTQSTSTKTSLPTKGEKLSSKDLKDSQGVKQRRYYDKNGNADLDIDYRHGGTETHTFPHRHDWTNGSRGKAY